MGARLGGLAVAHSSLNLDCPVVVGAEPTGVGLAVYRDLVLIRIAEAVGKTRVVTTAQVVPPG